MHRLDKIASGVLLIAKSHSIAQQVGKLFSTKDYIKKYYVAIVSGIP